MKLQDLDGFADNVRANRTDSVQYARDLRPWLADRALHRPEREGRVSAEATAKLIDAGLTRVGQPARFGGKAEHRAKSFASAMNWARPAPAPHGA